MALKNTELDYTLSGKNHPSLLDVVVSNRIFVYPDFYNKCAVNFPMIFSCEASHVGKTSVGQILQFTDASTEKPLFVVKRDVVLIHPTERIPIALPDDYLKRLQKYVSSKKSSRINVPNKPESDACHKFSMYIVHSDFDGYGHVNQAVYVRLCLDAVTDAFVQKHFIPIPGLSFDDYDVKQVDAMYIGEIAKCEEVIVFVWSSDNNTFHCQIENKEGKVFHKATITYYTTDSESRL